MSRSNPQEQMLPNPATRIFEWNGGHGHLKTFDKAEKKTTTSTEPFVFILLDELGCVRGFDQALDTGIYSNLIRDSRADVLVVKRNKAETVAEGIFRTIKPVVNAAGGEFHVALYIAFKGADGKLQIGELRFKGAALNAWIEFSKKHKADLYAKAIAIDGVTEGQKGAVKFKVPKFTLRAISEAGEAEAKKLDVELQAYLSTYFAATKRDQTEHVTENVTEHVRDEDMPSSPAPSAPAFDDINADDIPF
jgi:hypothetical protein